MSDGFVTVAQCVEGLPLGRTVWELLFCCFLGWFLLGAINESAPMAFSFVSEEASWINSTEYSVAALSAALALGNFLAILVGGYMADMSGRVAVVRPSLVLTIVGGLILQVSRSFAQAVLARFLLGLASGSLLAVMPPLIAELLPLRCRGFYLTIWTCGWPLGALFTMLVGAIFQGFSWRTLYTIILVPGVTLYVGIKADMLPESPRYLYLAGRRDDGYATLLDMYERQSLPLPWSAETIAVTCGPPRANASAKKLATSQGITVTICLALAMFAASAAAQSMKLWMPTMLVAHQEDMGTHALRSPHAGFHLLLLAVQEPHLAFAGGPRALSLLSHVQAPLMLRTPNHIAVFVLVEGYLIQFFGIILAAYISLKVSRRSMVQYSLLAAALSTLAALAVADCGYHLLCGPLVGISLAAQITGLNFLQVFALEYFPTASRAKTIALGNFAAQFGNFTIPLVGGLLVRGVSASGAIIFFSVLYVAAWILSHRLPLQVSPERSLHDVDEPAPPRGPARDARKREWVSYQTI